MVRCFASAPHAEVHHVRYGCASVCSRFLSAELLGIVHPLEQPGLFRVLHLDDDLGLWRICTDQLCRSAFPQKQISKPTCLGLIAGSLTGSRSRPLNRSGDLDVNHVGPAFLPHRNLAAFRMLDEV